MAARPPDQVIHLAARVGGIGYNLAEPASLYLANLLMGTYVIEAARRHDVARRCWSAPCAPTRSSRRCPSPRASLWDGYPEETNAPYGIAKKAQLVHAQANAAQYGQRSPTSSPPTSTDPGDKFHPSVSHVIPALIKKCVERREAGEDKVEVWGTGAASREYLYVDDAAAGHRAGRRAPRRAPSR